MPSLKDELRSIGTVMPAGVVKVIDQLARRDLCSRSDVLRSIILAELRRRGLVANASLGAPV